MTTYSQAWHDTPKHIAQFYVNHARRNLSYLRPPFSTFGYQFNARAGRDLAYRNWTFQLANTGSFRTDLVSILDYSAWDDLNYSLPLDPSGLTTTYDQMITVPAFALDYPRNRYRVPRHTWTGKPRRRQNLT